MLACRDYHFLSFFFPFVSFFLSLTQLAIHHISSRFTGQKIVSDYVCVCLILLLGPCISHQNAQFRKWVPPDADPNYWLFLWLIGSWPEKSFFRSFYMSPSPFSFFFFPSTSCSRVLDVMTVFVNIAGGSQQDDVNMPNNTWPHAILL